MSNEQNEQNAQTRRWCDIPAAAQKGLLELMPAEVRRRVRRGDMPTEDEVADLLRKHHDLGCVMILWKVSLQNPLFREECRRTVRDAFVSARQSLEQKLGPQVREWSDLQVMCMAVPAPDGCRWELTTERTTDPL